MAISITGNLNSVGKYSIGKETTGFRHYRILATSTTFVGDHPYFIAGYEWEIFESSDLTGTNIALNKTVTASSSNPSYPPSNLVDGNETSLWSSPLGVSTPQWLAIDLGSAQAIGSMRFKVATYYDSINAHFPQTFDLQASTNGTDWTTIKSLNGVNTPGAPYWMTFTNL